MSVRWALAVALGGVVLGVPSAASGGTLGSVETELAGGTPASPPPSAPTTAAPAPTTAPGAAAPPSGAPAPGGAPPSSAVPPPGGAPPSSAVPPPTAVPPTAAAPPAAVPPPTAVSPTAAAPPTAVPPPSAELPAPDRDATAEAIPHPGRDPFRSAAESAEPDCEVRAREKFAVCPACEAAPDEDPGPIVPLYSRFPYEPGNPGYVRREPLSDNGNPGLAAGRIRVEGGYAGAGVWRVGGELLLQLWRLGFANDLTLFTEPAARNSISVGNFAVPFSIVMRPRVLWTVGPGLTYVLVPRSRRAGRLKTPLGPAGTTRLDVFPAKPVVLSARFDAGRLLTGDHNLGPSFAPLMVTARGQIGFLFKRSELYVGYEYKRMGNVSLRGPVTGVRVWF